MLITMVLIDKCNVCPFLSFPNDDYSSLNAQEDGIVKEQNVRTYDAKHVVA